MRLLIPILAIGFFCPNVSSIFEVYSNPVSYQKAVFPVVTRNEIPEKESNSSSNNFFTIIASHLKANKIDLNSLGPFLKAVSGNETEFPASEKSKNMTLESILRKQLKNSGSESSNSTATLSK